MKKKSIIITAVIFVVFAALTFILPQEIPVHFGVSGPGPVVNKYFILLFTPVPPILYWAITKKYKN